MTNLGFVDFAPGGEEAAGGESPGERVRRLFSPSGETSLAERRLEAQTSALVSRFLSSTDVSSEVSLAALSEQFCASELPAGTAEVEGYVNDLYDNVVRHSVQTSSPRYVGHMTSALPYFVRPLARLLVALNQNMVKVETAKSLTPLERQVLATMHRLVYERPTQFYREHAQQRESTLGMVVSGGTVANITALWCARNRSLPPAEGFAGVEQEGLAAALDFYGQRGAVIIGSALLHYSCRKAADLLGIGARNVIEVPVGHDHRIDLARLRETVAECRARRRHVVALVGIAGTTESGAIDPLAEMAEVAAEAGVFFHVDAAWGGAALFSARHRPKLAGIERADSVTVDGHKQLYLPMGIGLVLLRDPRAASAIEKQARYIVRAGSADLGRRALEGSRPAMALLLDAALNLIGRQGYEHLIDEGVRKARYMADVLRRAAEFELLVEPMTNIVLYRYVPPPLRAQAAAGALDAAGLRALNRFNECLQREQRRAGRCFVSRTSVGAHVAGEPAQAVALRAVLANPLTTERDIDAVLADQIGIASRLALD